MTNVPDVISNCPPNIQSCSTAAETTPEQSENCDPRVEIEIEPKASNESSSVATLPGPKDAEKFQKTDDTNAESKTNHKAEIENSPEEEKPKGKFRTIAGHLRKRRKSGTTETGNKNGNKNDHREESKHKNKSRNDCEEDSFEGNLFNRFAMTDRDKVDCLLEKTSEENKEPLWKVLQKDRKRNDEEATALKLSVQLRNLRQKKTFDHESDRENKSLLVAVWKSVITSTILYNVIFGILRLCFQEIDNRYLAVWTALDDFADVAYVVDIIFNIRISFLYEGLVVSEPNLVRHNYLQHAAFKLDVISALPIDFILRKLYYLHKIDILAEKIGTLKVETTYMLLCRVNKLLKLGTLFKSFATTEHTTNFPNVVRILRLWLYIAIIVHWNACIFFALSHYIGLGSNSWVLGGSDEGGLHEYIIESMEQGQTMIPNQTDQLYIAFELNSHYFEINNQPSIEEEGKQADMIGDAEAESEKGCNGRTDMVCVLIREQFWQDLEAGEIDLSYMLQCRMDFSYTLQLKNKVSTESLGSSRVNNSNSDQTEPANEYLDNTWPNVTIGGSSTGSFASVGNITNTNNVTTSSSTQSSDPATIARGGQSLEDLKWGLVDKMHKCQFSFQYIYALYWSTLTLTTIGETPLPESDLECMFMVVDFLLGVVIFASIVGNVGTMISNLQANETNFKAKLDTVKQYMYLRRVDNKLERKIIRWFDYIWHNYGYLDQLALLQILPPKLRAQIALHIHVNTLKRVTLFADCEPGLVIELVVKMKPETYSPGDFVCRKGDIGKEMYIIKQGQLAVVAADDTDKILATLKEGSYFGEISILDIKGNINGNKRTANIKSICYTDLFALSKTDLMQVLKHYPEAHDTMQKKGKDMLIRDNMYDPKLENEQHD